MENGILLSTEIKFKSRCGTGPCSLLVVLVHNEFSRHCLIIMDGLA